MSSVDRPAARQYDDTVRTGCVAVRSFLGRLVLRTHTDEDTDSLVSIYSDEFSRRYLQWLRPPRGWSSDGASSESGQWSRRDYNDRVRIQNETRLAGKSCVFNIILLATGSTETADRCIGTTGFVTIDGPVAYLGIITSKSTTRMGFATEALYTSVAFAFERLAIDKIVIQTQENNVEMRSWCEKTAGLTLGSKKWNEINGHGFTECQYEFTFDQWNESIRDRLEAKMNAVVRQQGIPLNPIRAD